MQDIIDNLSKKEIGAKFIVKAPILKNEKLSIELVKKEVLSL
jgi:hypothetical protein